MQTFDMDSALYDKKLEELFVRFPSVQKVGFTDAYKPGLAHMEEFCALLGHPDKEYRTIHVAGTNGKGSVANMLACALAATGLRVGLYTSPHILDFRERMRVIEGAGPAALISREDVWQFICTYGEDFDRLDLSFFEITTGMAFKWFADRKVDLAVIEVGLGGRLDSTNIIRPELSIVTSIGLDHCAMLGDTREAIAAEKAGIFKPGVPALAGTRDSQTAPVFERTALAHGCQLTFASDNEPEGWSRSADILERMDLQGAYQKENLRTVMTALGILGIDFNAEVREAIVHTAARMDFGGRWQKLQERPDVICDIGHNPPALKKNFAQLEEYLTRGRYARIIIVYGVMADKDLDGILPLMPLEATYITVAPGTTRAMGSDVLYGRCLEGLTARGVSPDRVINGGTVADGVSLALEMAATDPDNTLIYIGGSTFVVSEATPLFKI